MKVERMLVKLNFFPCFFFKPFLFGLEGTLLIFFSSSIFFFWRSIFFFISKRGIQLTA